MPWVNKGVNSMIDLLNENGHFYDFDEFKEKFNIHRTFLDHSIIRNVPNSWRTKLLKMRYLLNSINL